MSDNLVLKKERYPNANQIKKAISVSFNRKKWQLMSHLGLLLVTCWEKKDDSYSPLSSRALVAAHGYQW